MQPTKDKQNKRRAFKNKVQQVHAGPIKGELQSKIFFCRSDEGPCEMVGSENPVSIRRAEVAESTHRNKFIFSEGGARPHICDVNCV